MNEWVIYGIIYLVATAVAYMFICGFHTPDPHAAIKTRIKAYLVRLALAAVIVALIPLLGGLFARFTQSPEDTRKYTLQSLVLTVGAGTIIGAWFMTLDLGRFPKPAWINTINFGLKGVLFVCCSATACLFFKCVFGL